MSPPGTQALVEGEDFYWDPEGYMVFTAKYLLKRGYCCHQGCRHCPYEEEAHPAHPDTFVKAPPSK